MWIATLRPEEAEEVLGPDWSEILRRTRALEAGSSLPRPHAMTPAGFRAALDAYGPNGPSVALFLESWRSVSWRAQESLSLPRRLAIDVVRLHDPDAVDDAFASPRWRQALFDAGFRATDPALARAFEAGERAGLDVGGPNARWISAGAAGELAQMPGRDLHFFLAMMPWVRAGYWPCGWDDATGRLRVV